MNPFQRITASLVLLAAVLPGLAWADAAWYLGRFSRELTLDGEPVRITVNCDSPEVCGYSFEAVTTRRPAASKRAENIQPMDVLIPNNNLDFTREAVLADAQLYGGREGPLLLALRPVLESRAKYRRCVGVPEDQEPWGLLCQLDSSGQGLPELMLLLPTMNPTCRGQAFCAYYALPLNRP
ncbi:MAG TPA: hypothetical protein VIN03_15095 [Roseateles sp.]